VFCQLVEDQRTLTLCGLEKVMLVVSTVDPVSNTPTQETIGSLLLEREKMKVGACSQVYESPSKRIRLASAEEEGGPCDSADGATPCGSKVGSLRLRVAVNVFVLFAGHPRSVPYCRALHTARGVQLLHHLPHHAQHGGDG
jgi:hypothetical protein